MVTIMTAILCTATVFINTSTFKWNDHDGKILKRAEYVCGNNARYAEFPCVKTMVKVEERTYRITCGVN